jgi:hypothetical protein
MRPFRFTAISHKKSGRPSAPKRSEAVVLHEVNGTKWLYPNMDALRDFFFFFAHLFVFFAIDFKGFLLCARVLVPVLKHEKTRKAIQKI